MADKRLRSRPDRRRIVMPAVVTAALLLLFQAADSNNNSLWQDLEVRRNALPAYRQEFAYKLVNSRGEARQTSNGTLIFNSLTTPADGLRWREILTFPSRRFTTIFAGKSIVRFEDDGATEHLRNKASSSNPPVSRVYEWSKLNWKRAVEKSRQPCGIAKDDHVCVNLEVPLKAGNGTAYVMADVETGLVVHRRIVELFAAPRGIGPPYKRDESYTLTRLGIGLPPDAATMFDPPPGSKQVAQLTRSNAEQIQKQYAGKPAPPLLATDIAGNPVSLESLKGKVILLDFWTTWCPPCRADEPSLEKLHSRYSGKDLAIIGISVEEERSVVEAYLEKHPHGYPVVLTSENDLHRLYQVNVFPSYIVIDRDGTLTFATEGSQGFSALKKQLKKAGLDTD